MRIHHGIADGVELAFPRRLDRLGALSALFERGTLGRLIAWLGDRGAFDPVDVQGQGLVVLCRDVIARQIETGMIGDEWHGIGGKLFA